MALPNQKFREIVFQALFSQIFLPCAPEDYIALIAKQLKVSRLNVKTAIAYADKVLEQQPLLDEKINRAAHSYKLVRIGKVELAILQLAVFEIYFEKKLQPKISIAEAVRLARKFSTRESADFINAVLDFVYQQYQQENHANKS